MKKLAKFVALGLVVVLLVVHFVLPGVVERSLNVTKPHDSYDVSAEALALHKTIPVTDLHADPLLWKRDLLKRSDRGHSDIPRLLDGGVAIQVMTAVTKSPEGQNYEENTADSDRITSLAIGQMWPVRTWGSLFERAMYQSDKLIEFAERSDGQLVFVRDVNDLVDVLDRRAMGESVIGAIYGLEGAHPLEGRIEYLDPLYSAGVRVLGLTHFFDNELGGSLHGTTGAGLTDFGREVVIKATELGMVIDLAHASEQMARDAIAIMNKPAIVSHTGFKGVCDSPRNFSDALMKQIAEKGGLIGVGYWNGAICDDSVGGIVKAIQYGVTLVGEDHVALGSDFDGSVTTQLDTSELVAITDGLIKAGMPESAIRKVMGENAIAYFKANLP